MPHLNVANQISTLRIAISVAFLILFEAIPGPRLLLGIFLMVAAQATDHLDGHLARINNTVSLTGWVFDSVADRAMYIAAILAFEREYGINVAIVWMFVFREICLYAMRVVVGDFSNIVGNFRAYVLVHAGAARLCIVIGCVLPLLYAPDQVGTLGVGVLEAAVVACSMLGYFNLWLLVRKTS